MDFKTIVNILFTKDGWDQVTDEVKIANFFIVNRYMSKKFPKKSQFFNQRGMDKATAMDIWYLQIKKERSVPFWFWQGPTKRKEPPIKDWKLLQEFFDISLNDIYILCEMFPDAVKDEIKRIQEINKEIAKV